jgi:hypothetical protein
VALVLVPQQDLVELDQHRLFLEHRLHTPAAEEAVHKVRLSDLEDLAAEGPVQSLLSVDQEQQIEEAAVVVEQEVQHPL